MKRLLMLMILAAGAIGQNTTDGQPNGMWWMRLTNTEKNAAVMGATAGFHQAQLETEIGLADLNCTRAVDNTYQRQSARTENITNGDMVREINKFYTAAENLNLPWANAFMYSEMKLAGATKAELDAVRLLK